MPANRLSDDRVHVPGYLNTASVGLPSHATAAAMHDTVARWHQGVFAPAEANQAVAECRERFGHLVGADPADVAIATQVSTMVGVVATSLPAGARVVCADQEFTSVLFPFLARADLDVDLVPLENLVDAIDDDTDLVAFAVVQSADGRIVDVDAVSRAAAAHGARTLADATQACGWLPVDAGRVDYLLAAAYKWLTAPRGSVFFVADADARSHLTPALAGYYAADDADNPHFGPPLRLYDDARGFDISPAWFSWVGTATALADLERLGVKAVHEHDVALAAAVRDALELPETGSAITCVPVSEAQTAAARAAGIRAGVRLGRLRLAFHHYNNDDDVDLVVDVLRSSAG